MLNVVKHLFADMQIVCAQFAKRSFAIAQDDRIQFNDK